jgi:hypothetical protein
MMIIVIKDSGKACQRNNGSTFAPKGKSLSKAVENKEEWVLVYCL